MPEADALDARIALIQALIPLGLQAVEEALQHEVRMLVEQWVGKVARWTTSDQKQRWLATTLLEIEPWLRRLRGYRALPQQRIALQQAMAQEKRRWWRKSAGVGR